MHRKRLFDLDLISKYLEAQRCQAFEAHATVAELSTSIYYFVDKTS
jgi:hypothetical protein